MSAILRDGEPTTSEEGHPLRERPGRMVAQCAELEGPGGTWPCPPQPCKCVLVTDLVSDGSLTWEFVLRTGAASWDYTSNAGDVFKKRAGLQ